MKDKDFSNPKKRWMIPIGKIEINYNLFEKKQEIESIFPFQFHKALYGDDNCPEEELDTLGSESLVQRALSPLIGQIIHLPVGERVIIQEVFINYWQQIGAHGEVVEPEEKP